MVHSDVRHDGGHLRLILDQPKGNIVSLEMMQALLEALESARQLPAIKLISIEGAGDHFSYGASVEEHQPDLIRMALPELHRVVRTLLDAPAPTAAIVRGKCLGGGFEIALACDFLFAGTTAVLGVPEITLGVFPPAASALLPLRIGTSRAASAILTGEARPVAKWMDAGLVEFTAPPQELEAAVDHWFRTHLASRSAAALRCAALASRAILKRHVNTVLPELERFYLGTLMQTHDAVEGIAAFIEKRPPAWSHS